MRSKHHPPARSWSPEHSLWIALWSARERSLSVWMQRAAARLWVVRLLNIVSRMGDGWVWYATIVVLPWVSPGGVGSTCAIRMVAVGLANVVIYKIIKRWIARPRPFLTCPGIRECARPLDEYSFPSGHTLHSVAFSLILVSYYPHLALLVWPFTLLVAVSRVILGLHYPSDVIVGAAIGALTAAISFNLL